jgi:hemoglobin-like flavoprotein
MNLLHLGDAELNVNFALETPESCDVPCAVVQQTSYGRSIKFPFYWSDLALLIIAVHNNVDKFTELLKLKGSLPRVFGKPPGTWELLYSNASQISHELLEIVVKTTPDVFKYSGGVVLSDFVQKQWQEMSPHHRSTIVHEFYRDILSCQTELADLADGPVILKDAQAMGGVYSKIEAVMANVKDLAECTKQMGDLVEKHTLKIFTPTFLYKAVAADNLAAVAYMLDQGCVDKIKAHETQEPMDLLRYAVEGGRVGLVLLLVERGADLYERWDQGRTTPMRYIKDHYSAADYQEVVKRWKKSEFQRTADAKYHFGMLKKTVSAQRT